MTPHLRAYTLLTDDPGQFLACQSTHSVETQLQSQCPLVFVDTFTHVVYVTSLIYTYIPKHVD